MKYIVLLLVIMLTLMFFSSEYYTPNATATVSQNESSWINGRKFSFYYIKKSLGNQEVIDIVLSVGKWDIAIDGLDFEGNSSIIKYQWFRGATVDRESGLRINEIPLNENILSTSDVYLLINPTVTGSWIPVLDPLFAYGMAASFNRVKMYEEIISRKIAFKANSTNMLRITNEDGTLPDFVFKVYFETM